MNSPSAEAVYRACDEAQVAADAILERSHLWLALHPIQTRRLRRTMFQKRDAMLAVRDAYFERLGKECHD